MQSRLIDRLKLPLMAAAVLMFQLFFYTQTLFESGSTDETRLSRIQILEATVAQPEPSVPNLLVDALHRLSSFRNLAQRLPLFWTALAIALTALALGDLARSTLLSRRCVVAELGRTGRGLERLLIAFGLGMGILSLLTQLLGLAGWLHRPVIAGLSLFPSSFGLENAAFVTARPVPQSRRQ